MPTALSLHCWPCINSPVSGAPEATSKTLHNLVAAGCCSALTMLANIRDFEGIFQGVNSNTYARLKLHALGEFLLQQGNSPLQQKGFWLFTPRKGIFSATLPYCINSGSVFQALSMKTDAGSCRCQHCWLCQCFWQGAQFCIWIMLSYCFVAPELHLLSAIGRWC